MKAQSSLFQYVGWVRPPCPGQLITEYNLLPRLYDEQWDEKKGQWDVEDPSKRPTVVKALQSGVLQGRFSVEKNDDSGLISISWVDEDPRFAKKMVHRVIEKTRYFLENNYETDAQREREFVARQLEKAQKELKHWERQVPSENQTYGEIQRELTAALEVYKELRKQLELAKIAEAKEIVRFKVLDEPFVPEQKFKPKRAVICGGTMLASGFVALFIVFFRRFLINVQKKYW